jgi:hypothetical protein
MVAVIRTTYEKNPPEKIARKNNTKAAITARPISSDLILSIIRIQSSCE